MPDYEALATLFNRWPQTRVFPMWPRKDGDTPIKDYPRVASNDAAQALAWMHGEFGLCNFAVLNGETSGLTILDIDRKNDRDGFKTLQALGLADLTTYDTLRVRTPSGGLHLYFQYIPGSRVSIHDHPGEGIDIPILVRAPGTRFDRGSYVIEHDAPIAVAPDALSRLVVAPVNSRAGGSSGEGIEWTQARRERFLSGDEHTQQGFVVWSFLSYWRAQDIPLDEAIELTWSGVSKFHNYDPGNPWTRRHVETKARSVWSNHDAGKDEPNDPPAQWMQDASERLSNGSGDEVTDVDGSDILQKVYDFLGRYIVYPNDAAHVAHTLWIAHTYLMDAFESTPRLYFQSPEKGSGKTRALEVTELLVPNPVNPVNASAAYLFRKVGDQANRPTILYDEIDTVFGSQAKGNEEIRAFFNAGHRRSGTFGRIVTRGQNHEPVDWPAYCAVALAGLGELPDTIMSRAVVVRMRKRTSDEFVTQFRRRPSMKEAEGLRTALSKWANEMLPMVSITYPAIPNLIQDRDADVWEPLLAVADAAGGEWPDRARRDAVTLVTLVRRMGKLGAGEQLLTDIKLAFGESECLFTETLVILLLQMEESPWQDDKLSGHKLGRMLNDFDIKSQRLRQENKQRRGYCKSQFKDAWKRYLHE